MPTLTPGELANVDEDGRLQIPVNVLRSVSWWTRKTFPVCLELTRRGLVRIYPDSAVRTMLKDLDSEEPISEAAFMARAIRVDRYRFLKLYGAEYRLRLSKEICPWLGFALGESAVLFAQAFPYGVEVMTMEHRFERLAGSEADVLPWTFNPPKSDG